MCRRRATAAWMMRRPAAVRRSDGGRSRGGTGKRTMIVARGAVSRVMADGRAYRILDEINVGPQVTYLTRVKNRGENV